MPIHSATTRLSSFETLFPPPSIREVLPGEGTTMLAEQRTEGASKRALSSYVINRYSIPVKPFA